MLPEHRPFSYYELSHASDEVELTSRLFDDYESTFSRAQFDFLWSEAYDRRHSGGLEEVYYEFVYLARVFYAMSALAITD